MKPRSLTWLIAITCVLSFTLRVHAQRPDVVLLITDQQRADTLSLDHIPGAETPHIDALARSGFIFTHAFCPTPQCSPTRAALLTGLYPHRTGVIGNVAGESPPAGQSQPLAKDIPNLASSFKMAGYETAWFGKWHLGNNPGEYGFDHHGAARDDEAATTLAIEFLRERMSKTELRRPVLLVVSWLNPHDIYHIGSAEVSAEMVKSVPAPSSISDDLDAKPFPQRHFLTDDQGKPFQNYTEEDWRRYRAFYHQLVSKVDRQIGEVLTAVKEFNAASIVALTSEHGDLGGAHGLPYKGPAMYEELIRVPLIISWPDRIAPGKDHRLVSSIDLFPTLADLAQARRPHDLDGRTLAPFLLGQGETEPWRDAVFGEYFGKQNWRVPIRMIRTDRWKYVRYLEYGEELYDLQTDPNEMRNLAGESGVEAIQGHLQTRLATWIQETEDPFLSLTVTDREGRELPTSADPVAPAIKESLPNIVMIVSDDQRWTDFGFMGHPVIKTPNLDKLASESVVFPNGYVPTSLCRASLATLLTGLYGSQHRICCNDPPDGVDRARMLPFLQNAPSLPRLLKEKGYASLQTGKFWEGHFSNGGFTHGMTTQGRHGGPGLAIGRQTMKPIYDFIEEAGEQPFFIWYAPMMPHEPHNPPERLRAKYEAPDRHPKEAAYWAMCEWFDETCGALLDHLEEKNLTDNTIVLFVVDNGWIQETGPVKTTRGWFAPKSKLSPYDGGLRTPIMIKWPGKVRPAVHSGLVSSIDIAPTLLAASGLSPTEEMPGINLLPIALGAANELPRAAVFGELYVHTAVNIDEPPINLTHLWIREGDWKAISSIEPGEPELYDLSSDPHEQNNLASEFPERTARLLRALDQWWFDRQRGH